MDRANSLEELLNLDKQRNGGRGLLIAATTGETRSIINAMNDLGEQLHNEHEAKYGGYSSIKDIVSGMTKATSASEDNAYTNGMMNSLLEDGNVDAAKAVRDDMLANGKKAASINSSLTSYWKPLLQAAYDNGDMAEVRRITSMLVEMGMKRTTVSGWTQEKSGSSSSSSKKKSGFGSGSFGSGSYGSSGKKSSKKSGFGSGSFGSSGKKSSKKSGFGSGSFGSGKFGS
jgi:pentatricopeptide repeat protein